MDAELFDSLQGESTSERNPAVSAEKVVRQVVDEIIEQLKRGTAPWVRPWTNVTSGPRGAMPYNGLSGRPYNGGNVLALWIAQMARGFTSAEWLTRRQAKAMGGSVQPGQAGTAILFFKLFEVPESQRDGEEDDGRRAIVKTFTVFNRDQCSGLPDSKWTVPVTKPKGKGAAKGRVPAADAAIAATGAKIVYGGNRAFYTTATDSIMVPEFAQFKAAEGFYGTTFHELGHWTGGPARLARKFGKKFGDDAYAFEELIAELTSAFCCATFGITSQLQHAEYIASWIKQLQADPNVLFRAAGAAEKAYQWIVPPAKPVKQNPGERLPKGFEGWRLDDVVQGVDRGTHKKAPIYVVRSPRGATGILVPTDGVYRFHEQLDLFPDSRPAPAGQGSLFSRNPASPVSLPDETDDYRISSAKYAKGMSALRIPSTDGYVHRAERLAKALKAKWSNREYAFILSPSKASKFKQLFVDGWDANGFNYELEAPAKPAVAPAVEAAKPSLSVAGGRARRQAVDRASPSPILTGQVHPDAQGRPVVTTFEKRGAKRVRVDVPVPAVPDWRRDLARPPRRISSVIACGGTPLTTGYKADAPIGVAYTASGLSIEYAWQVVDLPDLRVSHDPWSLQPMANFPQELQPRDRSRKSYDDQLRRFVQTFEPALLTWSATVADGAPIVGPDGVVESGNGRTMALSRIYREGGAKADEYRKTIKRWADFLGCKWHKYERPVLVRVRQTAIDRAEFARLANMAGQQGLAAAEQALADAAAMPLDLIRIYQADSGIGTHANTMFVQAFLRQVAGGTAVGQFTTEHGKLSKAGELRIELAMFAKAWGVESAPLLTAWSEDPESDLRVVIGAMAETAPRWLSLAAAVADGTYAAKYLIGGSVVEAAIVFRAAKMSAVHVQTYLRQMDLVQQPSALAEAWIGAAHPNGRRASKKGLIAAMSTYIDLVEQQGPLSQGSMFGSVQAESAELVRRAVRLSQSVAA